MTKIKVREVFTSIWSNSDDKPHTLDSGLMREDHYDADGTLHIVLSCDHEEYHVEETEADTFNPVTGHDTYTTHVVVCSDWDCDQSLDIEPDFEEPDYSDIDDY